MFTLFIYLFFLYLTDLLDVPKIGPNSVSSLFPQPLWILKPEFLHQYVDTDHRYTLCSWQISFGFYRPRWQFYK